MAPCRLKKDVAPLTPQDRLARASPAAAVPRHGIKSINKAQSRPPARANARTRRRRPRDGRQTLEAGGTRWDEDFTARLASP
jgi:hypothetical protein